jgi:hypothetical protein
LNEAVKAAILANSTRSPRRIFKPRPSKNGTALSIQLRITPVFGKSDKGTEYIDLKQSSGGLFLDLVPQGPKLAPDGKSATFEWDSPKAVTAGLGLVDLGKMLLSYRLVRLQYKTIPPALRKKLKPGEAPHPSASAQLSLFHQTPGGGSCAITWTFGADSSTIQLSRSAEQRQSIVLSLDEEVVFVEYLENALKVFNDLGY